MPRSLVCADCCVCVCACVGIDVYVFSRLIAWFCCITETSPNTFDPLHIRNALCCVWIPVSNQSFESFIPLSSRPWRDYSFFGVECVREAVRDMLIHNCRVKAQEVILESCKRVSWPAHYLSLHLPLSLKISPCWGNFAALNCPWNKFKAPWWLLHREGLSGN